MASHAKLKQVNPDKGERSADEEGSENAQENDKGETGAGVGGDVAGGDSTCGGGSRGEAESEDHEKPACLPHPSSPSVSYRKTFSESMNSTASAFQTLCSLRETPRRSRTNVPVSSLSPSLEQIKNMEDLAARERRLQDWIESVTGKPFCSYPSRTFARNLKNGERLCELVNALRPGTIQEVHRSPLGYKQMANIQNFLGACRAFGLEGHELVAVADVFEMKCTAQVVDCLYTLRGTVKSLCSSAFVGTPPGGQLGDPNVAPIFTPGDKDISDACRDHGDKGTRVEQRRRKELRLDVEDINTAQTARSRGYPSAGSGSSLCSLTPLSDRVRMTYPEVEISPRALVVDELSSSYHSLLSTRHTQAVAATVTTARTRCSTTPTTPDSVEEEESFGSPETEEPTYDDLFNRPSTEISPTISVASMLEKILNTSGYLRRRAGATGQDCGAEDEQDAPEEFVESGENGGPRSGHGL